MPLKISITGVLGGGKTAVCNELEKMNIKIFSTGLMQRKLAVEMGMTTLELNEYAETHPEIDKLIDSALCELAEANEDIVIDSRMAWHFIRDTFKVFLWTDETVAAKRIISHERGPSEKYADVNQARGLLRARKLSEDNRFKEKYGVDCGNFFNYDLIVDTTDVLPDYVAKVILERYLQHSPAANEPLFLISPRCLYPTAPVEKINGLVFTEEGSIQNLREANGSAEPDAPVKIIYADGCFYIYDPDEAPDGYKAHRRVASLFKSNAPLIACELATRRGGLTGGFSSLHKARAWEELNGFKYAAYPPC